MKKLLLVTGILIASGSLMAASMPAKHLTPTATGPQGWYVGIGLIGPESFTAEIKDTSLGQTKQDNYPLGGEIFAGYRINQNFGTELLFSYLSDLKWKDNTAGNTGEVKVKENYRFSYDGILYMPIANGFEAFGKAGIGFVHQKQEGSGTYATGFNEKITSFALNYGVGVGYNYQQFGISFDYTHYKPSTRVDDMSDLNDILGLDVQYWFG